MFTTSNCNIILLSLALGCFVSGSVVALLQQQEPSRRAFLARTASLIAAGSTAPLCIRSGDNTASAWAADDGEVFKRQTDKFSYIIKIPASMKQSQKPVKTHLDEINFVSETVKGYQYGITIDPVRITSLREFGKPEEVAARVVTAEVNRDGIFEVTLLNDPYESDDGRAYVLEYLSVGKRGNKHYYNKIFIANNQLYVLTAQVKEEDFSPAQKEEIKQTLASFVV